jgi:uncharacterized protein YjbJ (UPF0337 family)
VNDDQVEGTVTQLKGQVKEGFGGLTGDEDLQAEGQADQLIGKIQEAVGDVEETVQHAGDGIKQGVGHVTSGVDFDLDAEGQADQLAGKVQKTIGDVKDRLRPTSDAIKQKTGMTDSTLALGLAILIVAVLLIGVRGLRGRGA